MAQFHELMMKLEQAVLTVSREVERLEMVEAAAVVAAGNTRLSGAIEKERMEAKAAHARAVMAQANVQTLLALAWEARNEDVEGPRITYQDVDCPECRTSGFCERQVDVDVVDVWECPTCHGKGTVTQEVPDYSEVRL